MKTTRQTRRVFTLVQRYFYVDFTAARTFVTWKILELFRGRFACFECLFALTNQLNVDALTKSRFMRVMVSMLISFGHAS